MNNFHIDGYQIDPSPIGSGCSGEVHRAMHLRTNKVYAAKRYKSMAMDRYFMGSNFDRLKQNQAHEGIVPIKSYQFDQVPYYAISEFQNGQTLDEAGPFKEAAAWVLIRRIASALGHAHKYGVLHGNLHPGNIFYECNREGDLKLRVGDFGAGMIGDVHHVDLDETAYFAPPEQLLCLGADFNDGKAEKWDVYRFGTVAFWLLNHTTPRGKLYFKLRAQEIAGSGGWPVPLDPIALATVVEKDGKLHWKRKIGHGRKEQRYREIIDRCLNLNPEKRPVDMRQVHREFEDIENEFILLETEERAAAELAAAESRVTRERLKQKTKLFTARALVTIFAAACFIATFYLFEYLNRSREFRMMNNELDQVVANQKAHISILGNKMEDTVGDLKQSRAAADASFYGMTQRSSGNQASATLMKELEKSRTYYVGILKEVSRKPEAAAERGRALHSLAHIEQKMSRTTEANDHFSKAIATFERALRTNGENIREDERHDIIARLADCYETVAMLVENPTSDESLAALSKAVWYLKQVLINDPKDTAAATRLAECSFFLGQTLDGQNRHDDAIASYSEAADRAVELRNQSESAEENKHLETMISKLQFFAAESLRKTGRRNESVDAYIAAIESIERLRSLQGYTREETLMMARSFLALGDIFGHIDQIKREDKDQVYNEALRLIVPLNRVTPDNVEVATLMCHSLIRLAKLELAARHWKDGYNLSVRGIDVLKTALESSPEDLEGHIQLAEARLAHLDFLTDDDIKARTVSLRGVQTATIAHEIFVKSAAKMSARERDFLDQKLRRIFSSYGTICSELGQRSTASKCLNYASFKLSYQEG